MPAGNGAHLAEASGEKASGGQTRHWSREMEPGVARAVPRRQCLQESGCEGRCRCQADRSASVPVDKGAGGAVSNWGVGEEEEGEEGEEGEEED